jgi:hypothetical protein
MAQTKTPRAAAKKTGAARPAAAKTASPLPTPETAKPASAPTPAKTVALRGGAAVARVRLSGKPYRTAAPHNQNWWKAISEACTKAGDAGAPVADMLAAQDRPNGVPAHFVGYALRRGYLAEVK